MGEWSIQDNSLDNSILSSDRMNMLEELMGSVTHEVRNPLAVVRGNLQILLWKEDIQSQHPDFKVMMEKIDSAMELLTEFLQTLKPQLNSPVESDINAVISSIHRLLEAEAIRQGHCISFELDKKAPAMLINPSQWIHLLYNMCFISFRYMDVSGDVVIRTNMLDEQTLVCSVTSSAPGCRLCNKEQDICPKKTDQMIRVCMSIADDLGGRFEVYPYAFQGVEIRMVISL